ncbi:MAG: hypothetical protein ACRC92_27560 [Peptostreptococcaceae bacterium]
MLDFNFQAYSDESGRDIMIVVDICFNKAFNHSYVAKTRVRHSTVKDIGFTQVPKILVEKLERKMFGTVYLSSMDEIKDLIEIHNIMLEAWYD